ncbi:hypothetical protein PY092_12360 [Muricauda sp. 334s03]|uniref:Uncharacterized protein n=1 Tax=Flagellimonas yonaguniensis TaxID=3031325 RepID=A0ABT5Y0T9_9FLAO|nr:hypothetical protein [[Muricauda] yonaguniensis]MDF0716946.1 hypothetical protein [[Muricauda] yonaguniensis]
MIEFIIAYDERDLELGTYFQKCRDELHTLIQNLPNFSHTANDVPANRCNMAYLEINLGKLRDMPFIIAAYTHGNSKQLVVNGTRFIDTDEDNSYFQNSFFYTNSCSSGIKLGPNLIDNNCSAFIGFDSDVDALLGDYYEDLSIKCDNYGITAFLSQEITAIQAYDQMRDNYTNEIQKLQNSMDILRAGILINARESLVFHGNKELTKTDLEISEISEEE